MNELDTRTLLTRLASEPPPPTSVDIDRAIATARSQRQRGGWLVAAAAAVVVLVLTLGVVAVLRPEGARPAPLADAPAGFDPLQPRLEVGWLPDGVVEGLSNAATTFEFSNAASSDGKRHVDVYALPRDGAFPDRGDLLGEPVDGPEINGQPSQWWQVAAPDAGGPIVTTESSPGASPDSSPAPPEHKTVLERAGVLRWEWAEGGHAEVRVEGADDPQETAAEVARSVRLDRPRPFAMPLSLDRPRGPQPSRTGATEASAIIEFGTIDGGPGSMLVSLGTAREPKYIAAPNLTLGGRPAHEDLIDTITLLMMPMGPGQELSVQCSATADTPAAKAANQAECRRVAASAQPVGTLKDRSTWSTSPLR